MVCEKLTVNGVDITVEAHEGYRTFRVPVDKAHQVQSLPGWTWSDEIKLVDGEVVVGSTSYNLERAKQQATHMEREARLRAKKDAHGEQQAELNAIRRQLAGDGYDTTELNAILYELIEVLHSWSPARALGNGRPEGLIKRAWAEVDRLRQADPIDLVVEALLQPPSDPTHLTHNQQVIRKLQALAIRSGQGGGLFEVPDHRALVTYFRERLSVTEVKPWMVSEVQLSREDFAPAEVIKLAEEDPDFVMAPTHIELQGKKALQTFEVTYFYQPGDDGPVPCALISVTHTMYDRHAPRHGRASTFPELPHGIQLVVEVTFNGRPLLVGAPAEELTAKFERALSGARSSRGQQPMSAGWILGAFPGGNTPPPWYKGPKVRS